MSGVTHQSGPNHGGSGFDDFVPAQRMGDLIDGRLALSRVGRAELLRETVDLTAEARAAAAELLRKEPGRTVAVEVADGLAAQADSRLVRVLLDNLLGNAWKFTLDRAGARIAVGATPHPLGAAFFVKDNGAGFDMEYADKLFRPFQRLHGAAEFPGTGIGLATVHRIVDRHGGRVWAEGEVDRGATFYFTLPTPRPGGRS